MKTITVQIGNTDDKLTQAEWAHFFARMQLFISENSKEIYFSGVSLPCDPWQNACWVFCANHEENIPAIKKGASHLAKLFRQDSIAWTEGETEFI